MKILWSKTRTDSFMSSNRFDEHVKRKIRKKISFVNIVFTSIWISIWDDSIDSPSSLLKTKMNDTEIVWFWIFLDKFIWLKIKSFGFVLFEVDSNKKTEHEERKEREWDRFIFMTIREMNVWLCSKEWHNLRTWFNSLLSYLTFVNHLQNSAYFLRIDDVDWWKKEKSSTFSNMVSLEFYFESICFRQRSISDQEQNSILWCETTNLIVWFSLDSITITKDFVFNWILTFIEISSSILRTESRCQMSYKSFSLFDIVQQHESIDCCWSTDKSNNFAFFFV